LATNRFLMEYKCSGCSDRKYEEFSGFALAEDLKIGSTKGEHFGYHVGVGNFRCGEFRLEAIWGKYR
jgi:hypothetical protein